MSRCLAVAMVVSMMTGCASNPVESCVTRTDCDEAEVCVNGTCQLGSIDVGLGEDAGAEDSGATLCGEACETELPCEIGVYDCSGDEPVCIRAGLREQGFVCREASNSCDQEDTCDGVSAGCADNTTAIGTPCDGGFCDGRGECGACQQGVACNPDACREGTIACSDDGVPSCEATGNAPDETSCGDVVIGGYSACEWDDDACAETGERSREIQEGVCLDGTCTVRSRTETMPCSRDREGSTCGEVTEGAWSACDYSTMCDESAERTRTITERRCQSAICVDVPTNEAEDCTRDTDGMGCGDPTPGPAGECMFSGECAVSGMRSRQLNTPRCGGGSCSPVTSTVMEACTRDDTMGDPCGSPTFGAWGACNFFDCDPNNGTRYRTVTSACTASQTCDPNGSGFELGTCTGDVTGSFCTTTGGGFGSCTAPGVCS